MDIELAKSPVADLSAARKILLLSLFCLSQFLDTFNTSALFSAIPAIATSTGLNDSQSVWLYSSYQISFAAFLLIVRPIYSSSFIDSPYVAQSGRMSDIYNPSMFPPSRLDSVNNKFHRARLVEWHVPSRFLVSWDRFCAWQHCHSGSSGLVWHWSAPIVSQGTSD